MYGGELPLKNKEYIEKTTSTDDESVDRGVTVDETEGANTIPFSDFDAVTENLFGEIENAFPTLSDNEDDGEKDDETEESTELICEDLLGYDESSASLNEGEEGTADDEISDTEESGEDDGEDDAVDSEDTEGGEEADESEEKSEEAEAKSDNSEAEATPKPRRVDTLFDFMEICIFTLAGVFIIMSFFFRYSIVDGGSMQNTLQHQERLLLTSFLYTPECGDVVVVQDKSTALQDPIVKRIIAVGGQTVKFTRTDVYVDGVRLDEPYVYTKDYVNTFGASAQYCYSVYPSEALLDLVIDQVPGVYYEIRVPEGEIFVMGDHRNVSKDSRDIGTLHEDAIIGKAIYRFYPFDKIGSIE